ncbi:hypothetical protein NL108_009621 [Boleophthalmus pectinirostris]|nr:hypothetical protein NL108_009621 [Boleophthalmus pectinirostris]
MALLILTLLFTALMCSVNAHYELPSVSFPRPFHVQGDPEFVSLTLDRKTAHRRILVSDNNRMATLDKKIQPDADSSGNSKRPYQVLGFEILTGHYYFEVEWKDWVDIGMMLGMDCRCFPQGYSGDNRYSWILRIYDGHFFARHDNVQEPIRRVSTGLVGFPSGDEGVTTAMFISGVVGVHLDYVKGILSFYEILDGGRASHLHTFRENFTKPLLPSFGMWDVYAQRSVGNSVSLVKPRLSPHHHWGGPERATEPAPFELYSVTYFFIFLCVCVFSVFVWHCI